MESIIDFLRRKLKDAGPARWPGIARIASERLPADDSIGVHLLRKLAYGDRDNPGIKTVQPLLDFFHEVERGERELPEPEAKPAPEPEARAA